MKLIEILDKDGDIYDNFIKNSASCGGAEFLQSFAWGEILKSEGASIKRVTITEEDEILLAVTLVKNSFYYYAPRGPIFKCGLDKDQEAAVLNCLFQEISQAKKNIFFRFEPVELEQELPIIITSRVLKKTVNLQPQKTLLLDLKKTEEELLAAMHPKTRYNIRLAAKKGLKIIEADLSPESFAPDFAEFWRLMKKTSARDAFKIHGAEHYRQLLIGGSQLSNQLGDQLDNPARSFVKLYFVEYEGQKIAAGIFSFYGNKVTYLHGASDEAYRQLMAPYLLQFEIIKKAQALGFKLYDFYGIDVRKWPGVTRFKKGFGGFEYDYAGTYDFVFKPILYKFYNLLRKLRRLI
jgi:lipid II:glycine glycyltransferase (peptidoglycan interpeptide bridge formation enzyme)